MPSFAFTQALTANQKGFDPLSAWRYRYAPYRAQVVLCGRTTGAAGNVTNQFFAGGQEMVQRSPLQVGGTAGVTPVANTTPMVDFVVEAGDLLAWLFDENAAATPTVDGIVYINPVG